MPVKGRKFISKKNAVTYRLVPRCQLDPNADSSEHVLVPVDEAKHEKFNIKLPASTLPPPAEETPELKKQIPAKGPQPDWDPDIVATFDDDFNHEDAESVLEDDFIALANGPTGKSQASTKFENWRENVDSDDGSLFSDDGEGKAKFTQYSLTSSVTHCTEDVMVLNEKFERLYETYGDDDIGALDLDSIEGYFAPDDEAVTGVEEGSCVNYKKKLLPYEGDLDDELKQKTLHFVESEDESVDDEEEVTEQPPKYDCQSIISTYSNTQNLPAVIKVEKKEKPVKIPTNLWKSTITKSNLKKIEREAGDSDTDSVEDNVSVLSSCVRRKNETPEEKRQRKQAVKQIRRESRIAKKENKLAFKEEKKRRKCVEMNANRSKVVPLVC